MTSRWLMTALLFTGWVVAARFLIPSLGSRPILLILSGVAFGCLTSHALVYLSAGHSTASSERMPAGGIDGIFTYPRHLRRVVQASLVFWPAMLLGAGAGVLSQVIDRSLFTLCAVVFGAALFLTLYLGRRVLRTIGTTEAALEVRSMHGRQIVIGWDDITVMEPYRFHKHGVRVRTRSGVDLYLDDSLPGYAALTALIRLRARLSI